MPITTQLRIYTITPGAMDHWVHEWSTTVYPLRQRMGYTIPGAWIVADENKFVWILRYEGSEIWEEKESAYYNSPERKAFNPDPARHIEHAEKYFLKSILPDSQAC